MKEIQINFEKKCIKDELFAIVVEKFLLNNGELIRGLYEPATECEFIQSQGNILGARGYILQIKGGGIIEYLEAITPTQRYIANIKINDIEENQEKTQKIISQLEKIAKAKSVEDVKEFLS
jgi:hypothetical protein